MQSLLILFLGVAVVLIGILRYRLPAFLALISATLLVAFLTPTETILRTELNRKALAFTPGDVPGSGALILSSRYAVHAGMQFVVLGLDEGGRVVERGRLTAMSMQLVDSQLHVAVAPADGVPLTLEPGQWVVHPFDLRAAKAQSDETVGERVSKSFGTTCGRIGILIALAAVVGKCLLDSGSADRIVRSALAVVGERGAPFAFVGTGFLLAIPVFFDTVFYLMMPLGKAMRLRTGRNYLLYILTIVAGGTMAHSLVPPTPGPLLVAEELGVDIGLMIMVGGLIGLISSGSGFLFASIVNRRHEIPLRETSEMSLDELQSLAARETHELPPLWLATLPILLPVALIAGQTVVVEWNILPDQPLFRYWMNTLGHKDIALTLATILAIGGLIWQKRTGLRDLSQPLGSALASGGTIILITAAGGAFGAMLQNTGITALIASLPNTSPTMLLVAAFFITMAIRTAQGSATVAMITAVGVLSGFQEGGALGCHPVYLAMAIGCGSKPLAWMNDSGFWVICKMSGMTESEGLRFITPMSLIMGVAGLLATLVAAAIWPMV
jgi:GntP family gluconate:H+ symporter